MTSVFVPFAVQQTVSAEKYCSQHLSPSLQFPAELLSSMVHWWRILPQSQALVRMVPLYLPSSCLLIQPFTL